MTNGKIHRRSLRLGYYDYSQIGGYFVTICVQNRKCLFGEIVDGEMRLNDVGYMVRQVWGQLSERFPNIELDEFVIMPNHVHGIIVIMDAGSAHQNVGAQFIAPNNMGAINRAPTLGNIIRTFKALTTYRVRRLGMPRFCWQRNYYEHVIRNESDLGEIREYIQNNPTQWALDRENPNQLRMIVELA